MTDSRQHSLVAQGLSLAYDGADVVVDLDLRVPDGAITAIVGANGSGKSTLLRGLGRLMAPRRGAVLLDGHDIQRRPSREVATVLGLMPQSPIAPEGIRVQDLVARGRYPHQGWTRRWSAEDDRVVAQALRWTETFDLADRAVDELSGGQRQRVWIATALAQQTAILLLDEPTTYLDVSHQIDLLDLLVQLNRESGRTIVMVLHDLNLACRYADHIVAMARGRIVASGRPDDVISEQLVHDVYGMPSRIVPDPVAGTPMVIPIGRYHDGSGR